MDLGTKEHTSLSVCHCLGRRLGEGAVQQAAAVPLRRQGEGGAAGGQGPTACRLPPGACRCQGEGGPEAEPRRGLAACALCLAPEVGPEGRGRPLPSAVALAGGGWGLGVGADPPSADARGAVVAYWRAGEAASGLGRTGEGQGRTVR